MLTENKSGEKKSKNLEKIDHMSCEEDTEREVAKSYTKMASKREQTHRRSVEEEQENINYFFLFKPLLRCGDNSRGFFLYLIKLKLKCFP